MICDKRHVVEVVANGPVTFLLDRMLQISLAVDKGELPADILVHLPSLPVFGIGIQLLVCSVEFISTRI